MIVPKAPEPELLTRMKMDAAPTVARDIIAHKIDGPMNRGIVQDRQLAIDLSGVLCAHLELLLSRDSAGCHEDGSRQEYDYGAASHPGQP